MSQFDFKSVAPSSRSRQARKPRRPLNEAKLAAGLMIAAVLIGGACYGGYRLLRKPQAAEPRQASERPAAEGRTDPKAVKPLGPVVQPGPAPVDKPKPPAAPKPAEADVKAERERAAERATLAAEQETERRRADALRTADARRAKTDAAAWAKLSIEEREVVQIALDVLDKGGEIGNLEHELVTALLRGGQSARARREALAWAMRNADCKELRELSGVNTDEQYIAFGLAPAGIRSVSLQAAQQLKESGANSLPRLFRDDLEIVGLGKWLRDESAKANK